MKRMRLNLSTVFLVALAFLLPDNVAAKSIKARKPNIIFIMADDLGYGDLSCYGQTHFRTPHLDRMAAEGKRFTQYYSGSTVCAPSRCALLTGYHTGHAYIRGNSPGADNALRPDDVIVSEILKSAGYTSGVFGKWGMGDLDNSGAPLKKGFDQFLGYMAHRHAHKHYTDYLYRDGEKVSFEKPVYSHDLIVKESLRFIRENRNKPFFLYLPFAIPHAGMEAPEEELNRFEGKFPEKPWRNERSTYVAQDKPYAAFAAMITRMDRDVGRLFQLLKDLGIDRDTIVFFTSDNGPHREGGADPAFFNSAGGLRGIKRDLYEGGIRVPFIVRCPGKIKPGTSDHLAAHWDFLPTAAELAGVAAPKGLDGISMVPELLGKKQKQHRYLYWEFFERGFQQAIRMGEWKGFRPRPDAALELYHLENDPSEQTNVAEAHPQIVKQLETLLASARTDSSLWPTTHRKK